MCVIEVWSNNALPDIRIADEVGNGHEYGRLTRLGLWWGRRDIRRAYRQDVGLWKRVRGDQGDAMLLPRHLYVIVRRKDGTTARWEHWGGHRKVPNDDERTGLKKPQYVRDRTRDVDRGSTDLEALLARDQWETRHHFSARPDCDSGPDTRGCLRPERVLDYQFRFRYPHSPEFDGLLKYRREKKGILKNATGRAINSNTFIGKLLLAHGIEGERGESILDLVDDPDHWFPGLRLAALEWDYADGWPDRTFEDWEREGDRIEGLA